MATKHPSPASRIKPQSLPEVRATGAVRTLVGAWLCGGGKAVHEAQMDGCAAMQANPRTARLYMNLLRLEKRLFTPVDKLVHSKRRDDEPR